MCPHPPLRGILSQREREYRYLTTQLPVPLGEGWCEGAFTAGDTRD